MHRIAPGAAGVAIHIDRRTDPRTFAAMRAGVAGLAQVGFLPRRPSPWGGLGTVLAALDGWRWLDARAGGQGPDYAFLLSGQDYPIKPAEAVVERLGAAQGRSFVEHYPVPGNPGWTGERGGLDRVEYPWVRVRGRLRRVPVRRRLPRGWPLWGGSAWWCLSAACLRHTAAVATRHPELLRFFRRARIPEELFFQTVLANSPLAGTLVSEASSFTRWRPRSPNPEVLTQADVPALRASSASFARKFDLAVDAEVLDHIDAELLKWATKGR